MLRIFVLLLSTMQHFRNLCVRLLYHCCVCNLQGWEYIYIYRHIYCCLLSLHWCWKVIITVLGSVTILPLGSPVVIF